MKTKNMSSDVNKDKVSEKFARSDSDSDSTRSKHNVGNKTNGIAGCLARHPNAWNDSATRSTDSLRCNIAEGRSNNHPLKFYCITPPSPNSWTSWIGISGEAIMRRRRRLHQAWQCGPGGWRWARDWPRLGRALTLALACDTTRFKMARRASMGPVTLRTPWEPMRLRHQR